MRPSSAVPIGMPAATSEPNATTRTMTATIKPSHLVALDLFAGARDGAGDLGLHAGVARRSDRLDGLVVVLGLEDVLVVLHVHERGLAVRAHRGRGGRERVGHGRDVVALREVGDGIVDDLLVRRVVDAAVGDVEHDASELAGRGLELLFQQVRPGLRFGAGNGEVVLVGAAVRRLERTEGDCDEEPHAEDPPGVAGTAVTEPVQEPRHTSLQ